MAAKWINIVIFLVATAPSVITGHAVLTENYDPSGLHHVQEANAVLKSIQSEDGDIIDCVDIYKQPAFSHPSLRNHKIQMKPSYVPTIDITSRKIKKAKGNNVKKQPKADVSNLVTEQLWRKNGSCPEGTVPIRRTQMKRSPESMKSSSFFSSSKPEFNESKAVNLFRVNHSVSILITEGYAYRGAKGDLALFNPPVELDDEYTLSHVSLESGPRESYEAVRSGWAVNPGVYGNRDTRFFTYWTADGSQKTGCFDHTCPGFVQITKNIALGAAMPISRPNGFPAAVMIIYIFKDRSSGNWWVNYGETEMVGYWPAELFSLLKFHAETAQWGGDVYSSRVGMTHPHTKTGMGSGDYAAPSDSGEVRRIRVLENSAELQFPQWATTFSDEFNCYNYVLDREIEDPEFYYGGPGGGDLRCP